MLVDNQPLKDFNSIFLKSSSSNAPIVVTCPRIGSSLSGVGNYSLVSIQQTGIVTIFTTDDIIIRTTKRSSNSINYVINLIKVSLYTSPPDQVTQKTGIVSGSGGKL